MVEHQFGEMQKSPQLEETESNADKYVNRFTEGGLEVVKELETEVLSAKLAARFNRNSTLEAIQEREPGFIPTMDTKKRIEQEGEAGLKRSQLLADLHSIQDQLDSLGASLKRVIIDIKASQEEF